MTDRRSAGGEGKWREQKGDSEFVKGALLRISDEAGKVILEWISEEKEKCIQGI